MHDAQISRYSRHLLLPEIDTGGQEALLRSRVLIIGLGGLGSPVALYLAASGIGTLVLSDSDLVDLSNLQRQVLHSTLDIGLKKTASAEARLTALNPEVKLLTVPQRLEGAELAEAVRRVDAVVDCSDNFPTRYALNTACLAARIPLISGSAVRTQGQVTVFQFSKRPSPCYRCLYDEAATGADDNCAQNGVFAPLTGLIGSIQAAETLKILLNLDAALNGHLLRIDALTMSFQRSRIHVDPLCPACSTAGQTPLEAKTGYG